jgi:hypothetical protein
MEYVGKPTESSAIRPGATVSPRCSFRVRCSPRFPFRVEPLLPPVARLQQQAHGLKGVPFAAPAHRVEALEWIALGRLRFVVREMRESGLNLEQSRGPARTAPLRIGQQLRAWPLPRLGWIDVVTGGCGTTGASTSYIAFDAPDCQPLLDVLRAHADAG